MHYKINKAHLQTRFGSWADPLGPLGCRVIGKVMPVRGANVREDRSSLGNGSQGMQARYGGPGKQKARRCRSRTGQIKFRSSMIRPAGAFVSLFWVNRIIKGHLRKIR